MDTQWLIDFCERRCESASAKAQKFGKEKKTLLWRWYIWWEKFWNDMSWKFI